jgi:2'-5' RNA ligase
MSRELDSSGEKCYAKKMAFAFKCFFSEESARPIRKIWDSVADAGLCSFLKNSGSTPGLTLGVFEMDNPERLVSLARVFAAEARPIEVTSWGLGSFPTVPAHVFLGMVVSRELTELHSLFLNMVAASGLEVSPLYARGAWVPHSTLAIRCDPSEIPNIMAACLNHETRISARIETVALVEIGTAREICRYPVSETRSGAFAASLTT